MPSLPAPILSKLAAELAAIRAEAASLEALVSAGAAALGQAGLMEAQKLDHVLQSLDSLTVLMQGVSQGMAFDQAVASLPLAHMVDRLGETDTGATGALNHTQPKLMDPELF
jgi:hypothetical protein